MAAIIRVKRKANENPATSFLVSCKRTRVSEDVAIKEEKTTDITGVFKFAATIQEKNQAAQTVRNAVKKEKLEKELKQHYSNTSEIIQKNRESQKLKSVSNRFKVVSKKRANKFEDLDLEDSSADEAARLFQLYDVVADENGLLETTDQEGSKKEEIITCNNVPMTREKVPKSTKSQEYVYDLYYMNKSDFDYRALENILRIEALQEEEYVFDDYRDTVEDIYDEEDDENAEDNWRNDYPDEDPHFFENYDKDYALADMNFGTEEEWGAQLDLQNRLTMMDGTEEQIYSSEDEENINTGDVWHPTTSYEDYKKRILKELNLDDT